MNLGPHVTFIIAAYSVAFAIIGGLIGWILSDHAAQKRALAELEEQGITRRSRANDPGKP